MQKIAAALVKAQRGFSPALKTSSNPHFRSKYADLAACVEAVIDSLNANGIFLMQPVHESESGVIVETLFVHESGETMSAGRLHVPATKQDAQGYGSAITYGRRYSLMAACGIAPEDDDGNAASKARKSEPKQEPRDAVISATAEAFRALDEDTQRRLRGIASSITAAMPDGPTALEVMESAGLENEERAGLWHLLDAQTRRALKAAKEAASA